MPTLSTTYGPGSVTTETPAVAPTTFDFQSNAPDTSFLKELVRRRMEKDAEEKRLREAAERRAQETHEFNMFRANKDEARTSMQAQAANRMQAMQEKDARAQIPDKWVYEMVPTGYGHMKVASMNPEYERWAAKHGDLNPGPDSVNFADSVPPGASASEPFISSPQTDTLGARSFMPAEEDERADFFGTGSTNRKQQAATMLGNARLREAGVDEYLRSLGYK